MRLWWAAESIYLKPGMFPWRELNFVPEAVPDAHRRWARNPSWRQLLTSEPRPQLELECGMDKVKVVLSATQLALQPRHTVKRGPALSFFSFFFGLRLVRFFPWLLITF